MHAHPVWIIDAFIGQLPAKFLEGNPAAVVLLDPENTSRFDDAWHQRVAREMNQSETAFILPRRDGSFGLRWFTPETEVDLCGHATLAAAHVLDGNGWWVPGTRLAFHTRSGVLGVGRRKGELELDFPAQPLQPFQMDNELSLALGLGPKDEHFDKWFQCRRAPDDLLVEMHPQIVAKVTPDFKQLRRLCRERDIRGAVVTGWTGLTVDEPYHFVSRFFAPAIGVDEDPVTGSAHTKLAPYWSEKKGESVLVGYQASQRGGLVRTECKGQRVFLSGECRTALRGELLL